MSPVEVLLAEVLGALIESANLGRLPGDLAARTPGWRTRAARLGVDQVRLISELTGVIARAQAVGSTPGEVARTIVACLEELRWGSQLQGVMTCTES